MSDHATTAGPQGTRRDFLALVAQSSAAIGAGAIAWAFIDTMEPSQDVIAAGAPIDVDLKPLQPGQQIVVLWRGKPILLVRHTPAMLKLIREPAMLAVLSDPDSTVLQQPPYATNWHRSSNPEYAVLVGVCTHLGCLPNYMPDASPTTPVANWPGGYFCPCHGSKYDLVGRVYKGVPAPYNLPVPPYRFTTKTMVRIGENPPGGTFTLDEIVQI